MKALLRNPITLTINRAKYTEPNHYEFSIESGRLVLRNVFTNVLGTFVDGKKYVKIPNKETPRVKKTLATHGRIG